MILNHNHGRLTEDGEIIGGGYVMGVNAFTDIDVEELPMGYNKHVHNGGSATSHLRVGDAVLEIERRKLGGTQSYSVRVRSLFHPIFLMFDTYICLIVNLTLVMSSIDFCSPPSYCTIKKKPPSKDLDDVSNLPTEVDWDKEGKVNLAPSQGGCGSCWTFASTAAIESHLAIVTGDEPIILSEQNILECAPNPLQCGGKFIVGLIHILYCNRCMHEDLIESYFSCP
jgi:cathepsin L